MAVPGHGPTQSCCGTCGDAGTDALEGGSPRHYRITAAVGLAVMLGEMPGKAAALTTEITGSYVAGGTRVIVVTGHALYTFRNRASLVIEPVN